MGSVQLSDGNERFVVDVPADWPECMGELLRGSRHPMNVPAAMRGGMQKRGLLGAQLHDPSRPGGRPPYGGLTPRGRLLTESLGLGVGQPGEHLYLCTATRATRFVPDDKGSQMRAVEIFHDAPTGDAVLVVRGVEQTHIALLDQRDAHELESVGKYGDILQFTVGRLLQPGGCARLPMTSQPEALPDAILVDRTVERLGAHSGMGMPVESRYPDLFKTSGGVLNAA